MNTSQKRWLTFVVAALALAAGAAVPRSDTAEHALLDPVWSVTGSECPKPVTPFSLRVGADTILPFKGVKKSAVGDARFAETCVGEDGIIHVTGRAWGSTTLTVWTDEGVATYPLSID